MRKNGLVATVADPPRPAGTPPEGIRIGDVVLGVEGGDGFYGGLGRGYPGPMTEHIISYNPKLKGRARTLRNKMTEGEVILWRQLRNGRMMGYDFDRQRPIDQFIVDFYCKALALAIEVDGAVHDGEDAQKYDRERQARLKGLGVRFLRFRDEAVRENVNAVCLEIAGWIRRERERDQVCGDDG